ncbi:hypothetical protein B296_00057682 [Ensete ventricosum]|uniref:Uncharacterized protein n=1 Tax=Ensete ventricosum TaxID=4639 RepID=A0A426XQD0_ENSVE|nr:hypothetical protein B296_00057682 [Ensete ventricosum]
MAKSITPHNTEREMALLRWQTQAVRSHFSGTRKAEHGGETPLRPWGVSCFPIVTVIEITLSSQYAVIRNSNHGDSNGDENPSDALTAPRDHRSKDVSRKEWLRRRGRVGSAMAEGRGLGNCRLGFVTSSGAGFDMA